jgi:hypothetical protein
MLKHRTSHVRFQRKNSSRQKTKASHSHTKVCCCHFLQDCVIYNQIVIKAIVMYYPPGHSQLHHQPWHHLG